MQPPSDQVTCPVHWLHQCIATAAACGFPILATSHPVRKLQPDHKTVSPQQATTSALGKRLTMHLKAAHCYHGESMHSFRRGRAIADTNAQLPDEDIMRKLKLKSKSVLQRNYQPAGRHDSGVKRLRTCLLPQATTDMPAGLLPTPPSCPQGPSPQGWNPGATTSAGPLPGSAAAAAATPPIGGAGQMAGSRWHGWAVPSAVPPPQAPSWRAGRPMPTAPQAWACPMPSTWHLPLPSLGSDACGRI